MKSFHTRKKKNFFESIWFYLLSAILLFVLVRANYSIFKKLERAKNAKSEITTEHQELQRKESLYRENISSLESERGREVEYRENFNVVRKGETLIKIVD